jgi:hypothetical protein
MLLLIPVKPVACRIEELSFPENQKRLARKELSFSENQN